MRSPTTATLARPENLLASLGRRMRAAAPPLFWTGFGMLALSLPTLLLVALDDRTLQGVSVWLKPWKFQFSLAVFLLSLALFKVWLPGAALRRRAARFVPPMAPAVFPRFAPAALIGPRGLGTRFRARGVVLEHRLPRARLRGPTHAPTISSPGREARRHGHCGGAGLLCHTRTRAVRPFRALQRLKPQGGRGCVGA
ncbi:MAG: hypothetical protein LH632_04285 [Rhodoferax sp.]|nr:hypothetical protein [Rhodoferax sp.]